MFRWNFKNESHFEATRLLLSAVQQFFKKPFQLCPIKELYIEEVPNHDKGIWKAVEVKYKDEWVCSLNLNVQI